MRAASQRVDQGWCASQGVRCSCQAACADALPHCRVAGGSLAGLGELVIGGAVLCGIRAGVAGAGALAHGPATALVHGILRDTPGIEQGQQCKHGGLDKHAVIGVAVEHGI